MLLTDISLHLATFAIVVLVHLINLSLKRIALAYIYVVRLELS